MHGEPSAPRHIVVVGLMGAGKSAVGRRLANRLGRPWRDSDRDIERATALTVRELRDRDGVNAMHALEARALIDAIEDPTPSVISAAASTVEVPECRTALERPDVAVVWLRASPRALARRFRSADRHRPAYGIDPETFLAEQAARRNPLFASLDPVVVDVDSISPGRAATQAMEALGLG
jgi:shikimate kinase